MEKEGSSMGREWRIGRWARTAAPASPGSGDPEKLAEAVGTWSLCPCSSWLVWLLGVPWAH